MSTPKKKAHPWRQHNPLESRAEADKRREHEERILPKYLNPLKRAYK